MVLNTNQFEQVPVRGQLDLQISKSGVISGKIADGVVDILKAGDPVKIDSTNTDPVPTFVAAAASDPKAFYLVLDVKRASVTGGDVVEVGGHFGPAMWMTAETTIAAGATVEQNANGNVQTLASGKPRGIALDPGVTGELLRVLIMTPSLTIS